LTKVGFAYLVADEAAGVEGGRVRIKLHRLDHVLFDDADLEREGRHGCAVAILLAAPSRILPLFWPKNKDSSGQDLGLEGINSSSAFSSWRALSLVPLIL